jgi:hypothetical protein
LFPFGAVNFKIKTPRVQTHLRLSAGKAQLFPVIEARQINLIGITVFQTIHLLIWRNKKAGANTANEYRRHHFFFRHLGTALKNL